jgi:hypothetical protein
MKTLWFSKSSKEDKEAIKATLVAGAPTLKLLKELLIDLKSTKEYNQKKPNYEISNWALEQADYIGSLRTLQEVIDLITIEEFK